MIFLGQTFSADNIARIQASISEGLEMARSGLSPHVCEWLDWQSRYGYMPVLLESLVDVSDYVGTCYRASNLQHVGETSGRERQDRHNACAGRKAIYQLPLTKHWR